MTESSHLNKLPPTRTGRDSSIAYAEIKGQRFGECSDSIVRRYLVEKQVAWVRDGVPFHIWLTTPACEVIDISWAMNLGTATTRKECAERIFYKRADAPYSDPPTYHPVIVGEDFLFQTGCFLELGQSKPA